MKRKLEIVCTVTSLEIVVGNDLFGQEQTSKANSEISPGMITAYFASAREDIPENQRPFVNIPTDEKPLPANQHLQVCQNFAW